jgi:uncharacterized membrane protein
MPIRPLAPRFYFALAALICLGVFFRFYHLDKKIFWMDEAASALRIAGYSQADLHAQTQRQKLWTSAELQKFQHIRRDFDLRDALRVLSKDAPQHTPLFYLLLRLWAGAFGDSVWALRVLPALLSLMVFPALWFLCRELFFDDPKRERIIFVALALMAVSPFHVLYAQEARQYSLMTVLLLASTALLLRALRCGEWRWWLPYAICLALGFYTHLLFALMWLAHAAIVATWFYLQRNNTREPSKTKVSLVPLISFGIAAVVAALLFVPWAIVLWQGQERAASTTSWMLDNSRPWYVVKTWVLVWSHLFYDPNQTQQWSGAARDWAGLAMAARLARIAVCGAILWALGFVWRRAPRRAAAVVLILAVVPFAAMALPDLLASGYRSTIPRYVIAAYIGMQLAVAYWVAALLSVSQTRRRGIFVFGAFIAMGIGSCALSSQARLWWNKASSYDAPLVARVLNRQKHPLLVTRFTHNTLAINRLLKPQVRIYFFDKEENTFEPSAIAQIAADAVFFYKPSAAMRAALEKRGAILTPESAVSSLWRLRIRSGSTPDLAAR